MVRLACAGPYTSPFHSLNGGGPHRSECPENHNAHVPWKPQRPQRRKRALLEIFVVFVSFVVSQGHAEGSWLYTAHGEFEILGLEPSALRRVVEEAYES